jgi:hypothetical protein
MCTTTSWAFQPPPVIEPPLPKGLVAFGPGGPPLLNAAKKIFDELFASPLVKLGVLGEWLFFQQAGAANQGTVDVKGVPAGAAARASAAVTLFSGHVPKGVLEPLVLSITPTGVRFFAAHARARARVTVTYTPTAGKRTVITKTLLLRR